jgi:Ca-activated chloride channel family protein
MKFKYGKYVPSLADEVDMEELVSALSELLLSSGFQSPYGDGSLDGDRTMQALHDAILDALLNGGLLPDDVLEQLFGEQAETAKQQLDELVQQIMQRMEEAGYITPSPELDAERERRAKAGAGDGSGEGEPGQAKFEVTDKALDFLGYRALRDLLGSIGHASAGRHDTRDMATGVDASGAPKPYEFGDTLNLDASATVLNAVTRAHRDGARVLRAARRRRSNGSVVTWRWHSGC